MIKQLLLLLTILLFSGCMNDRGVSLRYYNDCEEYYDAQGYYHKKCDENIMDYSDVKKAFTSPATDANPKVW
jgi:predicted GNAT superfamily acetyltransferase